MTGSAKPAITQFQKKQEARFMCSACGADRGCNCNAPAVERLAEIKERARQRQRAYDERKRQQKQQSSYVRKPVEDSPNLLIQEVSNGVADFSDHVDEWLEKNPDAPDEALGALAMAISNASDILAELAARINRGVAPLPGTGKWDCRDWEKGAQSVDDD